MDSKLGLKCFVSEGAMIIQSIFLLLQTGVDHAGSVLRYRPVAVFWCRPHATFVFQRDRIPSREHAVLADSFFATLFA